MMISSDWYRRRRYIHFDPPIGEKAAHAVVSSPARVAAHAFYPLIRFTIKSKKVKWDKATKILVSKEKERNVSYAAHLDSHIYAYYALLLGECYEAYLEKSGFSSAVLAFRRLGKNNIHFARDAFDAIRAVGECDVIASDFSDFFGNLDHAVLKAKWSAVLSAGSLPSDHYSVYKSLTKYTFVEKRYLYAALGISQHNPHAAGFRVCKPEEFRDIVRGLKLIQRHTDKRGIPQGTPISAMLSNIYMIDFDQAMWTAASEAGGRYFRYCDDILIIVPKGAGASFRKLAETMAAAHHLPLHPEKTDERFFRMTPKGLSSAKPLQYLGFMFDGRDVFIRSASLAKYSDRMRRGVRLARATMRRRNELRVARGEAPRDLYVGKLYKRYSYLGRRNFISYAIRASEIIGTKTIKRQVKPLWGRLKGAMRI
ncbi:antiviral reverse transcriptase Drt2 [Ralstonia sp. 24A2]|uniref:antiviral reverse transcriptase Drt2 n=1 Tax=Ralstonia sp. 24A2 TaxID=3447364 RepID=UPI003F6A1AA3